ncbi:thermonuclease family protein [Govanella unica]|uniref:Thermonuclease family protein n=1 Tax=Govanella unica TaxID=2975056 RepID=A0A9X3TXX4_9PROT|nr:thermonuclease family protein [Govania unica]MDA5193703.1 thermonuclease family protein [Govania unica]
MKRILNFEKPITLRSSQHRRRRLRPQLPLGLVLLGVALGGAGYWGFGAGLFEGNVTAQSDGKAFPRCGHGPRINCVIDGDTFYFEGDKVRISSIDAPEISSPQCSREAKLGEQATQRLQEILNAGSFTLVRTEDRDRDKYGRQLRDVMRDGKSIGDQLVEEGLAHPWRGFKRSWCR